MTHSWNYKAKQAADYISKILRQNHFKPTLWMVLGSGFRDCVDQWKIVCEIPMSEIPCYPTPNVAGHGSKVLVIEIQTEAGLQRALVATGRVHLYEGFSPFEVSLPVFIAHELGIQNIVLTNAAGHVSDAGSVGTIVVISDHINFTGQNIACIHPHNRPIQFVDMADAYCPSWRKAVSEDLKIATGVYAGMLGPTFETAAEARMLKTLGADLAGMSTVQEAIAARMNSQRVFACSFVTNVAGGTSANHNDVLSVVNAGKSQIRKVMTSIVKHAPQ